MRRLLFEKKGNAVWISHLDLMRLFQRAFKRAGFHLTHTQGYNPRPSVSIALPLSVGVESSCELLDFELEDQNVSNDELLERLNKCLVSGIKVLDVYEQGKKIKELALLRCVVSMEYDRGVPENAIDCLQNLFGRNELLVTRKSKNGMQEQDIIPMIRSISFVDTDAHHIEAEAVICCQNPSLNPMQIPAAIKTYLPEMEPDHSLCRRVEIFTADQKVFR